MSSKYRPIRNEIGAHLINVHEALAYNIKHPSPTTNQAVQYFMQRDGITMEQVLQGMRADMGDIAVCLSGLEGAQTIIVDSATAFALREALDSLDEDTPVQSPFEDMVLQFTTPIPEREFMEIEEKHWSGGDDKIRAIIYSEGTVDGKTWYSATAYYSSGEINRVKWAKGENHRQFIQPVAGRDGLDNKGKILAMTIGILTYLNCENVVIEKQGVPAKVNRKRQKQGKRIIEDYYVTRIEKTATESAAAARGESGRTVSYRFEVRAHVRRLKGGKSIWIKKHERGVAHEPRAIERVYAITGTN